MPLFLQESHFLWRGETNKVCWWRTISDWCGLFLEGGGEKKTTFFLPLVKMPWWEKVEKVNLPSSTLSIYMCTCVCVCGFYKIHFNAVGWFSVLHVYSTVFCRKYWQFFLGKGSSHGAASHSHPQPCVCTGCVTAGHWAIQLTSTFMHSLLAYILNQHNYTDILVTTWRFIHTHTLANNMYSTF